MTEHTKSVLLTHQLLHLGEMAAVVAVIFLLFWLVSLWLMSR